MATKAQQDAIKKYQATQENIVIRVPKGKREEVKSIADKQGLSLQAYIKHLIQKDSGIEF